MDPKVAEAAAVRSMMADAMGELDSMRAQLGFAPHENNIIFRTRNEESANGAYVDATRRYTEEALLRQQGQAQVVEQAQVAAEEELAGPRAGTAEALQFAPAPVTSESEQLIRSLERSFGLPSGALAEVQIRDTESPEGQATSDYLAAWKDLTGRDVVFVAEQRGGEASFAGAVDPAHPERIYLHARGIELCGLAGHEWPTH
jgi:hypothetical protein